VDRMINKDVEFTRLPAQKCGNFCFLIVFVWMLGLLFIGCFHFIFLLLYERFCGQHYVVLVFLNYHLTVVPCQDEWEHFVFNYF
jgi:hypothetical protein